MKKLFAFFVCAICALMLFACNKTDDKKDLYNNNNNNNNTGEETADYDKALDAKYKGLAKDKKIYLTTIGQADVDKVQSFFDDLEMEDGTDYVKKNNLTADEVEDGAVVFMVIGTSGKGLGSAGTDLNKEKNRANAFVEKEGITLVVFHVGGYGRRGDTTDPIIDIVAPKAKVLLIVNGADENGNTADYDGKFAKIAKDNNIDLYKFSKTSKMISAVKTLLDKE